MRSLLLALVAAVLAVLAFPPYRLGFLIVPALAVLLWELRTGVHPARTGLAFGLSFFAGLIWWVGKVGLVAVAPLVVVFALYLGLYGWWLGKARTWPAWQWQAAAVGGWAAMEAARVRFPVGGFEWGLAGHPLGEYALTRATAQYIGASGLGVVVVMLAAAIVVIIEGKRLDRMTISHLGIVAVLLIAGSTGFRAPSGPEIRVAIVQGSTPCPLTHCSNERFQTLQQHLDLTRSIPAGSVDLVVWAEGSTGGFNADPVLVPAVAAGIGAEAQRIGAYFLVGGDRPLSELNWINANVLFSPDGVIVGEYRKRHPVPFGEYIPARPLFDWIPALDQVPRDMIPGPGPVVFDLDGLGKIGSVISFEGAFARYSREEVKEGALLLVVATNEGSYNFTPVSDQFLGMTRLRAAELGVDVVHAAVTGKSAFITDGGVISETADFTERRVITATLHLSSGRQTLYTQLGEQMQTLFIAAMWPALRARWKGRGRAAVDARMI